MAYGIALVVSGSRGNRMLFLCTETGMRVCSIPIIIFTIRQLKRRVLERVIITVSTRDHLIV